MCVFDNIDAFNWHDAEQQRQLSKCPKCVECGEPIQDEYCYCIDNELLCSDCMDDHYKVSTEDYER